MTAAGFGERAALSFDDREVVLTLSSAAADGEWLTGRNLPPDLGAGLWGTRRATGWRRSRTQAKTRPRRRARRSGGKLTFDEGVDVDTKGATPRLTLDLDDDEHTDERWVGWEDG